MTSQLLDSRNYHDCALSPVYPTAGNNNLGRKWLKTLNRIRTAHGKYGYLNVHKSCLTSTKDYDCGRYKTSLHHIL